MKHIEVKRDIYLNRLINKIEDGSVKIITGLRRSGKSYLLNNLFYDYLLQQDVKKECIIKLALDDDRNIKYRSPDALSEYLYSKITNEEDTFYFLLDEIQFAITEEEYTNKNAQIRVFGILNGLLRLDNVDIYITGSNSKFLSSDVATEFRGRGEMKRVI